MTWMVTGGAGYIGSHVARTFAETGLDVVVLDDLSSGIREFVPDAVPFAEVSVLDTAAVERVLTAHDVSGVVHLAGYKFAGESVKHPLHTYTQNVTGMVSLLEAMNAVGVGRLVFSSSAGVYGTPESGQVTEQTPPAPTSPYGETKLIGEWLLDDMRVAAELSGGEFRHTCLRYFNVVGSGYDDVYDVSPFNLFPKVMKALTGGQAPQIFGTDYPTPDGTSVKDYVHVADLATAHVAAARALDSGTELQPVYNLGSGTGVSVKQIVESILRITGYAERGVEPVLEPRRPGDPACVTADGSLAARDLGWRNTHSLDDMVASAWRSWQRAATAGKDADHA